MSDPITDSQHITYSIGDRDPLFALIDHFKSLPEAEQRGTSVVEGIQQFFNSNARKHHYEPVKAGLWWRFRSRLVWLLDIISYWVRRPIQLLAERMLDEEGKPIRFVDLRVWDETEFEYMQRLVDRHPGEDAAAPTSAFVVNQGNVVTELVLAEEQQHDLQTGPISTPGMPFLAPHIPVQRIPQTELEDLWAGVTPAGERITVLEGPDLAAALSQFGAPPQIAPVAPTIEARVEAEAALAEVGVIAQPRTTGDIIHDEVTRAYEQLQHDKPEAVEQRVTDAGFIIVDHAEEQRLFQQWLAEQRLAPEPPALAAVETVALPAMVAPVFEDDEPELYPPPVEIPVTELDAMDDAVAALEADERDGLGVSDATRAAVAEVVAPALAGGVCPDCKRAGEHHPGCPRVVFAAAEQSDSARYEAYFQQHTLSTTKTPPMSRQAFFELEAERATAAVADRVAEREEG